MSKEKVFQHIAYQTTMTKGGKLGKYQVVPAASKKYGIFFATNEEEQADIESWPSFKDGKIKRMSEEVQGRELNDVLSHSSVNPQKGVRSHAILKYFTATELVFCNGLSADAYKAIREAAIEIAEADKGEKLSDMQEPEEVKEADKGNKGGKKDKPLTQLQQVKNRLNELGIPFGGNINLKTALGLLPDGDDLKPKKSEEQLRKEAMEDAAKLRADK